MLRWLHCIVAKGVHLAYVLILLSVSHFLMFSLLRGECRVKSMDFGVKTDFDFMLIHLRAVASWTRYLTSLNLSFHICKVMTLKSAFWTWWHNIHEESSTLHMAASVHGGCYRSTNASALFILLSKSSPLLSPSFFKGIILTDHHAYF